MVRPIHLQDNLSKAPLAGREQQIQQSTAEQGQRQIGHALNQEHVLDQSRTRASAETDTAENRVDDREEHQGQSGSRGRRGHGDEGAPESESDSRSPDSSDHIIDVVA